MLKDPTEFKDRFLRWKKGELVYEAGLPKYEDGTPTRVGDYNVYPSAIGASELNVTTPEVVVTGTDRRPLYLRYDAEHSAYDPNTIRNFTDWLPIIGDIGAGIDIKEAIQNKNYLYASILGGTMVLPPAAGKAIRPLLKNIPYGRLLNNAERLTYDDALESMYLQYAKDAQRFYDYELPKRYELEDATKKVFDFVGTNEYYTSVSQLVPDIVNDWKSRNFAKEITRNVLNKLGFPNTYNNVDKLLNGEPLSNLTEYRIKPGEMYNFGDYDPVRIKKSSVEEAIPYVRSMILDADNYTIEKVLDQYPILKSAFAREGILQKDGKPFLEYIPRSWDGVLYIIDQIKPRKIRDAVSTEVRTGKHGEEVLKLYRLYYKTHVYPLEKATTDDGAEFFISPNSVRSAAYFSPEEALKNAQRDFGKILPGESWALTDNGALSSDSYTLLEALTRRHKSEGAVHFPKKKDGSISMLKLNSMGKYRNIDNVKKAVKNLEKEYKISLPTPFELNGSIFAPNFYWTRNL